MTTSIKRQRDLRADERVGATEALRSAVELLPCSIGARSAPSAWRAAPGRK